MPDTNDEVPAVFAHAGIAAAAAGPAGPGQDSDDQERHPDGSVD